MNNSRLNSMLRRSAGAVWTTARVFLLPITLLGWAVDDTMKTLAAAIVFATAPDVSRKRRNATVPRQH